MRGRKWLVLGAVGFIFVKLREVECPGGGSDANITVGVGEAGEKKAAAIKQESEKHWAKVEGKQELAQAEQQELESWMEGIKTTDQSMYQKAHDEKMAHGWEGVKAFKETGKTYDQRNEEIQQWMNVLKTRDQTEYDKAKHEFDNYGLEAAELYRITNKTWEQREEEQKALEKWMNALKDKNEDVHAKVMALSTAKGWEAVKQVKTAAVWLVELKSTYPNGPDAMDYVVAMDEFESNGWEPLKQWKEGVELNKWIDEADKVPAEPEKKKDTGAPITKEGENGNQDPNAKVDENAEKKKQDESKKQELTTWMEDLKNKNQTAHGKVVYEKTEYELKRRGWRGVEKARELLEWMEKLKDGNQTVYDRVNLVLNSKGWEGVQKARRLVIWLEEKQKVHAARNMDPSQKMDQLSLVGLVVSVDDQKEMTERFAADKRAREAERQGAKQVVEETLTRSERVILLEWVARLKVNDNNKFKQALQEYKHHGWEGLKLFRETEKPCKQREEEELKELGEWVQSLQTRTKPVYDKVNEVLENSGCEGVKRVKALAMWLAELNSTNSQEFNKAKQELDTKGWKAVKAYKAKLEKEEADKIEAEGKVWVEGLKNSNKDAYDIVKSRFDEGGWAAVLKYKESLDWLTDLNTNNNNAYKNALAELQKGGLEGLQQLKNTGKTRAQRDEEAGDKAKESAEEFARLEQWMNGLKTTDRVAYQKAQNAYNMGGFDALKVFKESGKTDQDRRAEFDGWLDGLQGTNDLLHRLVMNEYNSNGWEAAAAYKEDLAQGGTRVITDAAQLQHGGELELALDCDGKITEIEREVTEKVKTKQKQSVQKIMVVKQLWVLVRWNRKDWDETQYDRWDDWEQRALIEELDEAEMGLKRQQQKLAESEQRVKQAMQKLEELDNDIKALQQAGVTVDDAEASGKKGSGKGKPGEKYEELELADGTTVRVVITDSDSTAKQPEEEQEEAQQQLTPDQQKLLRLTRERNEVDEQVKEELEGWASRRDLVTRATQRLHKARTAVSDWDNNMTTEQKKTRRNERINKRITQVEQELTHLNPELEKLKQEQGQELKVSQLEAQLKELEKAKKVLTALVEAEKTDGKIKQSEQELTTAREALEQRKKKSIEEKETRAAELKKELEKEKNDLNDLKTKLDSAKNKDKPALEEQLKQAEQAVKFLDAEVKLINAAKLKEELENANKKLEALKRELEGTADAAEKQTLQQQVQQAEEKVQQAASALKGHDQDMMNKNIEAKKKELQNATTYRDELKTKLTSAKNKDKPALEQQITLAEQNMKSLDDEVKFLESEKKLKEDLENAIKQNDTPKIKEAEKALEKHEADRLDRLIKAKKKELEEATKELDDLKTKLSNATKDKDKKALGEQIKQAEQAFNLLDGDVKIMDAAVKIAESENRLLGAEEKLKKELADAVAQNDMTKIQKAEHDLSKLEGEWNQLEEQKKKLYEQKKQHLEKAKEALGEQKYKLEAAKNEMNELEVQVQQAERSADQKSQALEDNQFITVWMKKTDYELMEIGRKRAGKPVPTVIAEQETIVPEQDEDGRYTERVFEEEVETDTVVTRSVAVKMVKLRFKGRGADHKPTGGHKQSDDQSGSGSSDPDQPDQGGCQVVWLRRDRPEVQKLLRRAKDQGLNVEREFDDLDDEGEVTPAEQQKLNAWMDELKNSDKSLYDQVYLELMANQWPGVRLFKKNIDKSRACAERREAELKAEAEAEKRALEARGKAWVEKRDDLLKDWAERLRALGNAQSGFKPGSSGPRGGSSSQFRWPRGGTSGHKPDIDWGGSGAGGLDVLFGGRDTASVLRQATFMTSWGGNDEFSVVKHMRLAERLVSGGVKVHTDDGSDRLYGWGGMGLGDVAAGNGAKVETVRAGTVLKVRDHLGRLKEITVKYDMVVYDGGSRSVWDTSGTLKLAGVHDPGQAESEQTGQQQPAQTEQLPKDRRKQLEEEWKASQQQKQAAEGGSDSDAPRLVLRVITPIQSDMVYATSSVGGSSATAIQA